LSAGLDKPLGTCVGFSVDGSRQKEETTMDAQKRTELAKTAISAAAKLGLFLEGQMQLTEEHYDACCEVLIDLLEGTRDEAYRLRKLGE